MFQNKLHMSNMDYYSLIKYIDLIYKINDVL